MQQAGDKKRLCHLSALALSFSIVESCLPHALPFLRLGLANIPLLWALENLGGRYFLALATLKWALGAFVSGTLISPYALVSLSGSLASAIVMLVLYRSLGRFLSLYPISAASSMASGAAQLVSSSLFLTGTVLRLLPWMLIFNWASGLVVAFLASHLGYADDVTIEETEDRGKLSPTPLFYLAGIASVAITDSIPLLVLFFILSLALCHITGRRIRPVFYLVSIVAVLVFNLFVPSGKVLWGPVTLGALEEGLERALKLSSLVALSQALATEALPSGLLSGILSLYSQLVNTFLETEGGLRKKTEAMLGLSSFTVGSSEKERQPVPVAIVNVAMLVFSVLVRLIPLP